MGRSRALNWQNPVQVPRGRQIAVVAFKSSHFGLSTYPRLLTLESSSCASQLCVCRVCGGHAEPLSRLISICSVDRDGLRVGICCFMQFSLSVRSSSLCRVCGVARVALLCGIDRQYYSVDLNTTALERSILGAGVWRELDLMVRSSS